MKTLNLPAYLEKEYRGNGNYAFYAGLEHERPAHTVLAYSEKEAKSKLLADVKEKLTLATNTEREFHAWPPGRHDARGMRTFFPRVWS